MFTLFLLTVKTKLEDTLTPIHNAPVYSSAGIFYKYYSFNIILSKYLM